MDRIEDLVATLNDLFGKFDDAADVSNSSFVGQYLTFLWQAGLPYRLARKKYLNS